LIISPYFCNGIKKVIMTQMQLNAELLRNMSIIAEDEMEFTREEFSSRIEEARKQPGKQFASVEELDQYIQGL
jgi:hypothetical protein